MNKPESGESRFLFTRQELQGVLGVGIIMLSVSKFFYMNREYKTKEEILEKANTLLDKSLGEVISKSDVGLIKKNLEKYAKRRKGFLGELVEKYFFEINPGNASEPDFKIAGIELKTVPIKSDPKYKFTPKERLVFSMINYETIIGERWESSSFLKKNKVILIMFYLWLQSQDILDYKFKLVHLLDLLEDMSDEDILQIRKDWEYIVGKIKRGEAHLLSEGDTYYLGAVTKAATSKVRRNQPKSHILAKPRAFSLKQQYLRYILQRKLLKQDVGKESIFRKRKKIETIEDAVENMFGKYIGKTDKEIVKMLNWQLAGKTRPKAFKRLLANRIMGVKSNKIEELEKSNVTLKAITLEHTGILKESLSFPSFDYKKIVKESWYEDDSGEMSDFYEILEKKKFLFVVFQKIKNSDDIILKKIKFWNFPVKDLSEVEIVWNKTIKAIKEGRYDNLPKISESSVAHVRPHGKDASDVLETPQGTKEMKKSFWLNAKYIEKAINEE